MSQKIPAPDGVVVRFIALWSLFLAAVASAIFITQALGKFNGLPLLFVLAAIVLGIALCVTGSGYDLGVIAYYKRLGRKIVRRYTRMAGCNR